MRLEKLIKSIVCASLVTAVCGVTAMAGTYTNTEYVRGTYHYGDSYVGSLGNYAGGGVGSEITTSATSTTQSYNNFCATAGKYDYNTEETSAYSTGIKSLSYGKVLEATNSRDFTSNVIDYYHNAKGYAGTSTTMIIDDFTYWGYQYYRSN